MYINEKLMKKSRKSNVKGHPYVYRKKLMDILWCVVNPTRQGKSVSDELIINTLIVAREYLQRNNISFEEKHGMGALEFEETNLPFRILYAMEQKDYIKAVTYYYESLEQYYNSSSARLNRSQHALYSLLIEFMLYPREGLLENIPVQV